MCALCGLVNTITAQVCALDILWSKYYRVGVWASQMLTFLLQRTVLMYFQNDLTFVFHPHPFLYLLFVLLRQAHLQGRCLLKTRRGRMSLLHRGEWACGKPAVTELWQKSAQLKRHRKRRTPPGWCARPLLLASHPHWTTRTRKRSTWL